MQWHPRAIAALLSGALMVVPAKAQTSDQSAAETCPVFVARLLDGDPVKDLHPRALKLAEGGRVLFSRGQYREALAIYDCAFSIRAHLEGWLGDDAGPGAAPFDRAFAALWDAIGDARMALGRNAEAREAYEFAFALAQSLVDRFAGSPMLGVYQVDLAMSHAKLGNIESAMQQFDEGIHEYELALDLAGHLSAINPEAPAPLELQIFIHGAMSFAYSGHGNADKALEHDMASLKIHAALLKRMPADRFLRYEYAQTHGRIGARGGEGACRHLAEAAEIFRDLDDQGQLNAPQRQMALTMKAIKEDQCKSQGGASSP